VQSFEFAVPIEQCVTVICGLFTALSFKEKGITEVLTTTLLRICCEDSYLMESDDVSVSVLLDIAKDRNGSDKTDRQRIFLHCCTVLHVVSFSSLLFQIMDFTAL